MGKPFKKKNIYLHEHKKAKVEKAIKDINKKFVQLKIDNLRLISWRRFESDIYTFFYGDESQKSGFVSKNSSFTRKINAVIENLRY